MAAAVAAAGSFQCLGELPALSTGQDTGSVLQAFLPDCLLLLRQPFAAAALEGGGYEARISQHSQPMSIVPVQAMVAPHMADPHWGAHAIAMINGPMFRHPPGGGHDDKCVDVREWKSPHVHSSAQGVPCWLQQQQQQEQQQQRGQNGVRLMLSVFTPGHTRRSTRQGTRWARPTGTQVRRRCTTSSCAPSSRESPAQRLLRSILCVQHIAVFHEKWCMTARVSAFNMRRFILSLPGMVSGLLHLLLTQAAST
jgi:hypothetical protein